MEEKKREAVCERSTLSCKTNLHEKEKDPDQEIKFKSLIWYVNLISFVLKK
jgi:hypothetical protein